MWKTELHPACQEELKALNRSNSKLVSKVINDLKLLREFGLTLMEEDRVKKLSKKIYELRTKQGSNINRLLFGIEDERMFVLVLSFVRKGQKTPKGMIEKAETRLEERKA